ncbi:FAD-binding and (Fe-S)-binding domain-containing protein [Streptomyces sp. SHP 1-2]|uniref:FAD-binding and (Fe-S)-binding domain-containing protein n=1 Tax=Streptomyces sp. SHP 1-2 TaxID=2769489 RepID=UPI002237CC26|nr:FAD-binding and (Fe-S)-binding domain-containing protein [Streptomyces sp. SHP 1-2]MCW5253596.1 FAD-binding protein [Streptomyces sp. SHP 1-2]
MAEPPVRQRAAADRLAGLLRKAGVRDVLSDDTTRAAYSSDASLYRVRPLLVVRPGDEAEVRGVMEVCRDEGVPIVPRGGGTSVAGNAIGAGVVLDFSRHMTSIVGVDADRRLAVVQPGVIQADLQRAAAGAGLRFGPDPSTVSRCTIGGMIGNNACGSRTLGYGRTSDNVLGLRGYFGNGERFGLDSDTPPGGGTTLDALRDVALSNLSTIRTEFGTFGRQVSGYALEHLAPERGFDVRRMLVGSEGTLAVTTEATVRLVRDPAHAVLVVLGYDDIGSAGDATPDVLPFGPTACEGIDARIVDVVRRRRGAHAVPGLPRGRAWLFVELAGDDAREVAERARSLMESAGAVDSRLVTDPDARAALWGIRADGAGLSGRSAAGLPAHAGWEDAAVPPDRLGAYLRDFEALMESAGVGGLPYGHFGDGCVHIRIDWPLESSDGTQVFRDFLTAAARLVAGYGGSLSGEHGDGRARSELLPLMYGPEALAAFAAVKRACDPGNLLNPGVVVEPGPVDADLRVPAARGLRGELALTYGGDDFNRAVHRCTGVGKCRADNSASGGVMCPSYLATRDERHSTRGRARVLQEMVNGSAVTDGWRSAEVHEALDLCLSCKGCTAECPTGVDMPAFKAEVLHQTYRRRLRPAAHYGLGWLPRWARLASAAPRLANAVLRVPGLGHTARAMAGVDRRRTIPPLAEQTFRDWFAGTRAERASTGTPVVLFVDSFTNHFTPEVGRATVAVLEDAGFRPELPDQHMCCGLTWISTGQLDAAKRILRRTVGALESYAAAGTPIVGMEPSCTAVLRGDARHLIGAGAEAVAHSTRTLAELLVGAGWTPPDLRGADVVAQPHCHHNAVMSWDADAALLEAANARVRRVGGCCGLAGNFGVEKGHYEVSVAVAEQQLLPAVRDAPAGAHLLADGYSCRTQLADLTDGEGLHLAQLLAARLPRR